MNTRFPALVAAAVVLSLSFACGCKDSTQTSTVAPSQPTAAALLSSIPSQVSSSDEDAIRQAVEDHVRNNKGINMSAMDMTVDSITVNGDQAQANATFRLKQGGTSMSMTYALARHANGWLVLSNQPSGGQFEHPPMDKIHSSLGSSTVPPPNGSQMPDFTDLLKLHAANNRK